MPTTKGPTPLTPEQSQLASEYFPYALNLAARWISSRPDLEVEIISAASLGLVAAARLFDPGCKTRFTTFALTKVNFAIRSLLRKEKVRLKLLPLDGVTIAARMTSNGDAAGEDFASSLRAFGRLIGPLPPKHRMVLRSIYLDGRNTREIASMSGFSRESIAATHRYALVRLRVLIEGEDVR